MMLLRWLFVLCLILLGPPLAACATTADAGGRRDAALQRAELAVGAARLGVVVGSILAPSADLAQAAELVTRAEQALVAGRAADAALDARAHLEEAERLAGKVEAVLAGSAPPEPP